MQIAYADDIPFGNCWGLVAQVSRSSRRVLIIITLSRGPRKIHGLVLRAPSGYICPGGDQFCKIMAIPAPLASHSWKRALISSVRDVKVANVAFSRARSGYEAISFKLTGLELFKIPKTELPPFKFLLLCLQILSFHAFTPSHEISRFLFSSTENLCNYKKRSNESG